MQKEKNIDYKLSFLIAQAVMCVILVLFVLIIKYLKAPISEDISKWYKENFNQSTSAGMVTDTSSTTQNINSENIENDDKVVNTSLDLSKTKILKTTATQKLNSIIWPVSNGVISSDFGYRKDPFLYNTALHKGIDIAIESNTPVAASADGRVVKSGYEKNGYGNFVILEHTSGFMTVYAHCNSIAVEVGQKVDAGQTIAYSGSTGRSTGPHLHFEVRLHGTLLDPLWILPTNDAV